MSKTTKELVQDGNAYIVRDCGSSGNITIASAEKGTNGSIENLSVYIGNSEANAVSQLQQQRPGIQHYAVGRISTLKKHSGFIREDEGKNPVRNGHCLITLANEKDLATIFTKRV